jgi:hypothetical protein
MEKTKDKAKVVENKLKGSSQKFDKVYSRRKLPQTTDTKNSIYLSVHLREENIVW